MGDDKDFQSKPRNNQRLDKRGSSGAHRSYLTRSQQGKRKTKNKNAKEAVPQKSRGFHGVGKKKHRKDPARNSSREGQKKPPPNNRVIGDKERGEGQKNGEIPSDAERKSIKPLFSKKK